MPRLKKNHLNFVTPSWSAHSAKPFQEGLLRCGTVLCLGDGLV